MCGATSQQKDLENQQAAFYSTMTANYNKVFAQSEDIMKSLTDAFNPILKAGIGQQGFTPEELAARETQATEGTAQNYAKAGQALGANLAAQGGGNEFLPSGAQDQLKEELAASGAADISGKQNQITEENYATGRQNFLTAAGILGGAPSVLGTSTGISGAATGAGSAAGETANQIAQAGNAPLGALLGAVGGVGAAAAGGYTSHH